MFLRPLLIPVSLFFYGMLQGEGLSFTKDVRPLLSDACFHCHGPDSQAREAKLRLDDRSAAFKAGVLTNGEMIERLLTDDPNERMPPPDSKRVLWPKDRAKLVQWLKAGAEWPEDDRHWAFVPPEKPVVPQVKNKKWAKGKIDRFILARLEKEGLQPSPEADKNTLLRRVTFDLTGLPPSPRRSMRLWRMSRRMLMRRWWIVCFPLPLRGTGCVLLAGCGPLCRYRRIPKRPYTLHVGLAGLGHPGPQRQHAFRPFYP